MLLSSKYATTAPPNAPIKKPLVNLLKSSKKGGTQGLPTQDMAAGAHRGGCALRGLETFAQLVDYTLSPPQLAHTPWHG